MGKSFKLLILSLISLAAWHASLVHAAIDPGKPEAKPLVSVSEAKKKELFDLLTYPAQVHSLISASVLAENDGVVTEIFAPLGSPVKKGQKVFKITHTDPVYNYAPIVVRSPVDGVVSLVHVTQGSRVSKGEKVAVVTDPDKVCLKFEVAAVDLPFITQGMEGDFKVPGQDESFKVKISGVSPMVDPATGTASAQLELLEAATSRQLAPGRLGQAEFKANLRLGFTVPDHTLRFRQNETQVRVVQNGKVKMVTVKLGKKSRGWVEILSGLEDGMQVIERTSRFITEGDEIAIQEESADSSKSNPPTDAG